jgi:outer membrane protein assembly factor BamB
MKTVFLCSVLLMLINPTAMAEDWPCFRGPSRQGISQETDVPLQWNLTSNVLWKTPIPGVGYSSPIVSDSRVYVTTATDEGVSLHLLCVDAKTGTVYWDKEVFKQKAGHKQEHNSYATPTPVTDGERIFVLVEDGTLLALSMDGDELWRHQEFEYYSEHGIAVSPILEGGLVIVPFDGSSAGPDKSVGWQEPWDKALVLAVDASTGRVRWRGKRGLSRIAHVVPQTVTVDGKVQVVSGAGDVLQGFDLQTGNLIWTVRRPGEGLVPSVVAGDGLIFAATGFGDPKIIAVGTGGQGECTDSHLVWETDKDVPHVPSFLYFKPYVYVLTERGVMTCFDAESGGVVWRERLRGRYSASPVWADGHIYCLSEKGRTTVIKDGPTFEVVAENELAGVCKASMAVSNGRLFIRSDDTLYAIGKK